jgi:hypothetical protein
VPIRDREVGPSRSANSKGKGKDYGKDNGGVSVEDDPNRLPEGFVSGYGNKAWKECGKVFPDERLLELVSELGCTGLLRGLLQMSKLRPDRFARSCMVLVVKKPPSTTRFEGITCVFVCVP